MLEGRRCGDCGTVFHPVRFRCPRCGSANLPNVSLPKTGMIMAATKVYQTGPESMIATPYAVALIQIDSGPLIEAVSATGLNEQTLLAGRRVRLVIETLGKDESGEEVMAYRFSLDGAMEESG